MVTLDDEVPGVRPGFSCVAEITTATRMAVVAVPIQAMTVMDVLRDADGQRVVEERPDGVRTSAAPDAEPRPGFTREETRGVFVIRDGRAEFTPVMVGISGERYFEVRSGLEVGDTVITGPFSTARRLVDGETVLIRDGAQTAP
jgi:HlyD family secretion protein